MVQETGGIAVGVCREREDEADSGGRADAAPVPVTFTYWWGEGVHGSAIATCPRAGQDLTHTANQRLSCHTLYSVYVHPEWAESGACC